MTEEASLRRIWHRFRRGGELRPLVCLVASAAAALSLAGLAIASAWLAGMTRPSLYNTAIQGDVRDGDIVVGLIVAGVVWLLALLWLWRPAVRLNRHRSSGRARGGRWAPALFGSVAIAAALVVTSYVVGRRPWDDVDYLTTGLWLLGAGVVVALWLPAVFHLERGRSVTGAEGRVNVHCPECSYSMVGLREAVCPECGTRYTIDELIRAQDYEPLRETESEGATD